MTGGGTDRCKGLEVRLSREYWETWGPSDSCREVCGSVTPVLAGGEVFSSF